MVKSAIVVLIAGLLWQVTASGRRAQTSVATPPSAVSVIHVEPTRSVWWESPAFTTTFGVALGALLTFGLGEAGIRLRERRTEDRVRGATRSLLKVELANNLEELRAFWKGVVGDEDSSSTESPGQGAQRFAKTPFPHWSRLMWASQAAHLALALSDGEIMAIQQLQSNAEHVANYHAVLRDVATSDHLMPRTEEVDIAGRRALFPTIPRFPDEAKRVWPNVEQLVEAMFKQGNPLD